MVIAEPHQAYEIARSLQNADDVVILTGSTYTIEQVLNPDPYLRYLSSTFGWRMEKKTEAKGTLQIDVASWTVAGEVGWWGSRGCEGSGAVGQWGGLRRSIGTKPPPATLNPSSPPPYSPTSPLPNLAHI